jgi:hypothetical protein
MWHKTLRSLLLYPFALLCLSAATTACSRSTTDGERQDDEVQMGQEVFNELKGQGRNRRIFSAIRPVATDCRCHHRDRAAPIQSPFKFYLVHETHPNAFATPGGNIISARRRSSSFACGSVRGIFAGSADRLSHSSSIKSSRSSGLSLFISISSLAITGVWHFPPSLTRRAAAPA